MNEKSGEGGKNSHEMVAVLQVGNWWLTGYVMVIHVSEIDLS